MLRISIRHLGDWVSIQVVGGLVRLFQAVALDLDKLRVRDGVDSEKRLQLVDIHESSEIVDTHGLVVGRYLPEEEYRQMLYALAESKCPFPAEELERLRDQVRALAEENQRMQERYLEVEEENKDFASRYMEIEEQNNNLANLYVASYQLHSTLDFREVIQIVQEIVINLVGAEVFAILLLDEKTNELGIENSSARVLPTNTVCLSRTASVGYVVVMGRPMATSRTTRPEIYPRG